MGQSNIQEGRQHVEDSSGRHPLKNFFWYTLEYFVPYTACAYQIEIAKLVVFCTICIKHLHKNLKNSKLQLLDMIFTYRVPGRKNEKP